MILPFFLARVALRRRWFASALLALLIGGGAGLSIAAVAGAQSNDVAIPHLLSASRADTVGVAFFQPGGVDHQFAQIKSFSVVQAAARATPLIATTLDVRGAPHDQLRSVISTMMDPAKWAAPFGRPLLVSGRMARPLSSNEIVLDEEAAARRHVHVGGHLRIGLYKAAQQQRVGEGFVVEPAQVARVTVAGIVRGPADLVPFDAHSAALFQDHSDMYAPAGFWRRYGPDLASYGTFVDVQLRSPADVAAFDASVKHAFGNQAQLGSGTDETASAAQAAQRGSHILSELLRVAAGIMALATLVLGGQALGRQLAAEADDVDTLRALGCSRRNWCVSVLLRTSVIAFGAAAASLVVAFAISPRFPISVARRAALVHPFRADWTVFAIGAALVVALVFLWGGIVALRVARPERHESRRPSRVAGRAATAGFPVAALAALQVGLDPYRGRGTRETLSRVAAVAVGVAVLAGAATVGFTASLDALARSPRDVGASFDLQVGNFSQPNELPRAVATVAADPDVRAVTAWVATAVEVNGHDETLVVLDDQQGHIAPVITEGREPKHSGEVALGATTMQTLHATIGSKLHLDVNGSRRTVVVVGREVADAPAHADETIEPGKGIVTTLSTVRPLIGATPNFQLLLLRLRPGADIHVVVARLQPAFPGTIATAAASLPDTVVNVRHAVGLLPWLLIAIAALAAGTLVHALTTSVRRGRHDLAVLKAVGFRRRQVGSVILYQALLFAGAGVIIGVPLGIALGRWTWRTVGRQLGVVPIQSLPTLPLLTVIAIAMALVFALALGPAFYATRVRAAEALRTE